MLKNKLLSVADIYSRYQELNSNSFYDAEEDLTRLSIEILNEKIFTDAHIFVDEFTALRALHISHFCIPQKTLTIQMKL